MKKILITLIIMSIVGLSAYADEKQEALDFFNNYVEF